MASHKTHGAGGNGLTISQVGSTVGCFISETLKIIHVAHVTSASTSDSAGQLPGAG